MGSEASEVRPDMPRTSPIPWERPHGHSAVGFVRTLGALVLSVGRVSREFPAGTITDAVGFYALVELLWLTGDTLTHAILAKRPLIENLERQLGLVGGLALVGLVSAAVAHLVASNSRSDARWSDAVRVFSYAAGIYSLLRIAILPFFAARAESMPHFAELAFVLYVGPLLFSAIFAVRAIRARYRVSLLRSFVGVVVLPALVVGIASLTLYGPH